MPSINPHPNGYRAQVYVKGARDSRIFRTRREATAWASARETELRAHDAKPPGEKHILADVMRQYVREVSPGNDGARFEELRVSALIARDDFPAGPIGRISPDDLGRWRDLRLMEVKPGTVLREIGLLSAIFEHARREWRYIAVNPVHDMRKPPAPPHRDVTLTRAQIKAMLRVMGYSPRRPVKTVAQCVAACFLLALRTGMRQGELCALEWADVFADYCRVRGRVRGARKTGGRDVPLTPKAKTIIEKMRGYDPTLVFSLLASSCDANFRKYRKRAGLAGFTFHDTRHTAATWLAQRLHILDLCKMFGWTDPKRAMVYYNPRASDIARRITSRPHQSIQSESSRIDSAANRPT